MIKRTVVPLLFLATLLPSATAPDALAQSGSEAEVPLSVGASGFDSSIPNPAAPVPTANSPAPTVPTSNGGSGPTTNRTNSAARIIPSSSPDKTLRGLQATPIQEPTSLTGESPYSLLVSRSEKSNVTLKRAAAFPIIYPISTTVAFVRGTADEFKTEMNEFKEQSGSSKKLAAPAVLLFLPLSAVAGFMRAPLIAGDKALTNKPFSRKAFCLEGDIETLE